MTAQVEQQIDTLFSIHPQFKGRNWSISKGAEQLTIWDQAFPQPNVLPISTSDVRLINRMLRGTGYYLTQTDNQTATFKQH